MASKGQGMESGPVGIITGGLRGSDRPVRWSSAISVPGLHS